MENSKEKKRKILIIDDDVEITDLISSTLENSNYEVITDNDGELGVEKIRKHMPDLVLLDVNLPKIDGREICQIIKSSEETKYIPIIMITGIKDIKMLGKCYESGTDDFLNKPFEIVELIARVNSMLRIKTLEDMFSENNNQLKIKVEEKTRKLQDVYLQTIKSLAKVLEKKDRYTLKHSYNVAQYSVDIALEMGLSDLERLYLKEAAELHDLGKVAIPDGILSKKDKLTKEEWEEIKKHPIASSEILKPLFFLNGTIDMIEQHHERYDGKGYPYGKKGDEIPLGARIIAVADAYEAMISDRPYRKALTKEKAIEELKNNSGKQFDPEIVKVFLKLLSTK